MQAIVCYFDLISNSRVQKANRAIKLRFTLRNIQVISSTVYNLTRASKKVTIVKSTSCWKNQSPNTCRDWNKWPVTKLHIPPAKVCLLMFRTKANPKRRGVQFPTVTLSRVNWACCPQDRLVRWLSLHARFHPSVHPSALRLQFSSSESEKYSFAYVIQSSGVHHPLTIQRKVLITLPKRGGEACPAQRIKFRQLSTASACMLAQTGEIYIDSIGWMHLHIVEQWLSLSKTRIQYWLPEQKFWKEMSYTYHCYLK